MDLQSHIHGCIVTLMILFFLIILYLFGLGLKSSAAHCFDKSTVTVLKPILALGIVFTIYKDRVSFFMNFTDGVL